MSSKISLWAGLIGIGATIALLQPNVAIAKTSVEIADTAKAITVSITEPNSVGSGVILQQQGDIYTVNLDERLAPIPKDTVTRADDYVATAAQKVEKKDYQGILADLDRAIQIDPNYAYAYAVRGTLKTVELQDVKGGLTDLDRAIQLNPNNADVYLSRGYLKAEKLQDIQGGLVDYNRAIQLNPNNALAYYGRGVLKYARLRNRSGGIADIKQAATLFKQKGNTKDYQMAIDLLKKWQQPSENSGT
jgi:tetratricopeptide (TPR) repeat protein